MIIAIAGRKQSGKDTVCKIIQYLYLMDEMKHIPVPQIFEEEYIRKNYNFVYSTWEKKMFTEKLKQCVCIIIGCNMDDLENNDFKNKELGEEWRVWYWSHYKLPITNNPFQRLGSLHLTKEEAEKEQSKWSPSFKDGQIKSYLLTPRLMLQFLGTDCGRKIIHPNIWVNATMKDYFPSSNWIISDARFPDSEFKAVRDREGLIVKVERANLLTTESIIDMHESETACESYESYDAIFNNNGTIGHLMEQVKEFLISKNII